MKSDLSNDEVDVVEVNAADSAGRDFAKQFNIKSVPHTLLLFPPDLAARPPTVVNQGSLSVESVRGLLKQEVA